MRLGECTSGSVYIDTNVLYMYLRSDPMHLSTIRRFLNHVVRGEIEAFVGVPVLDELFYRLLLAQIKDASDHHPLDVLRRDLPGAIDQFGGAVESSLRQLMGLPYLSVVGVEAVDGESMLDNIRTFKLLPRDALYMAIMQRLSVSHIASDDVDFDQVEGIERVWLINSPHSE